MSKHKPLTYYFNKLEKLAFKRKELLQGITGELHFIATEENNEWAGILLDFMTVPYTLWGSDFQGFGQHVSELLADKQELSITMKNILRNYSELPSEELMDIICQNEHEVQNGNYDQYLTLVALAKYENANKIMLADPAVHADIADFFKRHPEFGAGKQVIRRRMAMERNFRQPGWKYNRKDPMYLASMEFDSLCHFHILYGVERTPDGGFKPLLQKLSVNATPHGVMIFIPRYWSLDPKRDIKWGALNRVMKAWGIKRSGIKWSATRFANTEQSKAACLALAEGTADGLTGEALYDHVKAKAKLNPEMDAGSLYRLIRAGEELMQKTKRRRKK